VIPDRIRESPNQGVTGLSSPVGGRSILRRRQPAGVQAGFLREFAEHDRTDFGTVVGSESTIVHGARGNAVIGRHLKAKQKG
jgi:hypothetical protein